MKVLTWNCNGAFRKKFELLEEFDADVVIIQECENPATSADKNYKTWASNYVWTGENPHKGLAVFANEKINLRKKNWNASGLKYFISCSIDKSCNLVAVWCHGDTPDFQYIGQFWHYLQSHKLKFKDCILTGDFNSNTIWDKPRRTWNHSDVVRELRQLKIESFYHLNKKEEQGKETTPTWYLHRNVNKPYHLDYIFGSECFCNRLVRVTVGDPLKWLKISDHMPVCCELA